MFYNIKRDFMGRINTLVSLLVVVLVSNRKRM